MHIVQPYRPLQVGFNGRVLEHNRRFFYVVSASLGISLKTGKALLDVDFLKDAFQCMGDNPVPDFGMPKPCGEFIVSGSYFAPEQKPVTGGEVRIIIGQSKKTLFVFGPRKWETGGLPSEPEPISSMPVDYFHAFGGARYDNNPDGMGYQDGKLPCIEDPVHLVASPKDMPEPAGVAPLALDCPRRRQFQGTYDDDYKKKYFPGYPEDFDWHYFLNTPEDQWIEGFFNGSESFEIYNMHPEIPLIKGELPGLYARAFLRHTINSSSPEFDELPLNLDTIWFFPEKLLALMIFRGVIEVADDEAEQITEVLLCYEDRKHEARPVSHYKNALEIRMRGDNPFLNYFKTKDLIPPGAISALAMFQEKGGVSLEDHALAQNMQAKADASKKMMDEKVEEAVQQAEGAVQGFNVPPDMAEETMEQGKFDLREMIKNPPAVESDSEIDAFTGKLEGIMPGITSGEAGKVDIENFPFDKIGEITAAAEELGKKKKKQAQDKIKEELSKAKENIVSQIEELKRDKGDVSDAAKDRISELEKLLGDMEKLEKGEAVKTPLPRLRAKDLLERMPKKIPPDLIDAMQHIQGMRVAGVDDTGIEDMEKTVKGEIDKTLKDIEEHFYKLEAQFRTGYLMNAHFMDQGLSPHKKSLEDVKKDFLNAVDKGEDVSGEDWACIDLSGENLDNIDLSGAFLEQVNFSGASLKGANLAGAIMARADLSEADFSNAKLEGANIGAVNAVNAVFVNADFKGAKLSKGNFTGADFSGAVLEDTESLYLNIDNACFSGAFMQGMQFLETEIKGADFSNADLSTTFFMIGKIEDTNFSGASMNRCLFANMHLKNVCFDNVEFCGSCFAGTDSEQSGLEGLSFRNAVVKKSNFQRMIMKNADFSGADLENSYFESADLTGADLTGAKAICAQFRGARLKDAKLDGINLMDGSLAKAYLVGASFKGANLFRVDFLRSTITNTDFSSSNLDNTLIENWRPA